MNNRDGPDRLPLAQTGPGRAAALLGPRSGYGHGSKLRVFGRSVGNGCGLLVQRARILHRDHPRYGWRSAGADNKEGAGGQNDNQNEGQKLSGARATFHRVYLPPSHIRKTWRSRQLFRANPAEATFLPRALPTDASLIGKRTSVGANGAGALDPPSKNRVEKRGGGG
jgi:hypothetical protein